MKITTRTPWERDKAFVRRIHHSGYRDVVVNQFGSWDQSRQDRFFEKKWSNANLEVLIVDENPCGFVTVEEDPDELRLIELVVDPACQGRGIGTEYLRQLIVRAEFRQVPIRLTVLLMSRASSLYRRMGFVKYGQTDTHFQMERRSSQQP